jgi:hypothetical protein
MTRNDYSVGGSIDIIANSITTNMDSSEGRNYISQGGSSGCSFRGGQSSFNCGGSCVGACKSYKSSD